LTGPSFLRRAFRFEGGYFTEEGKQGRQDSGLDPERTEAAVQKTRQWRDEKQLPFPDFASEEMEEMRDSMSYPPSDSAFDSSATLKD
jgi:hypothetical protein